MPSPYKCKKCKDTGYLLNGKHCSCYSGIFRKVVYMGSEYSHLFDECTFENIDYMLYDNTIKDEAIPSNREIIRQIADQAARLARDFNNKVDIPYANFLLLGSVGVGKTYISIAITNEFIKKNIYVKFITAIKLADILSSYDDDMYKEYELLKEVPLLVIDDLGTEYGRGAFSSRFLDLISYRQSNKLPMVITSNMNISDIVDDYSERLWSKLQQNTRIYVIEQNDIRHKIN